MRSLFAACLAIAAACGGGNEANPGELLARLALRSIAVDDSGLYGSSGDATVVHVDLASRNVTTVVDLSGTRSPGGVVGIALVGDSLYLGYESVGGVSDAVLVMPKSGGAVSPVAVNEVQPFGLLADQERLYWHTDSAARGLEFRTVLRAGGAAQTLASSTTSGWSLALGDDAVYWADQTGITRALKSDLVHPQVIYTGAATSLAVDSTTVYFLGIGGPSAIPKTGGLRRTIAGTIPYARFAADQTGVYAMATDPRILPFGPTRVVDGETVRLPTYFGALYRLDGRGAADIIANAVAYPMDVKLDATHVYWSLDTGVYRVPR